MKKKKKKKKKHKNTIQHAILKQKADKKILYS